MITVEVKTKTGHVQTLQFEEILRIDGEPYVRQASEIDVQNIVADLVERVAVLEAASAASTTKDQATN